MSCGAVPEPAAAPVAPRFLHVREVILVMLTVLCATRDTRRPGFVHPLRDLFFIILGGATVRVLDGVVFFLPFNVSVVVKGTCEIAMSIHTYDTGRGGAVMCPTSRLFLSWFRLIAGRFLLYQNV